MAFEKTVSFKSGTRTIVGTARVAQSPKTPTFLLLHGFTGNRNELVSPSVGIGIFEYVAARLADLGHSSVRIDFGGWGDIRQSSAEVSIDGMID